MAEDKAPGRRRRQSAGEDELRALLAARDKLDADKAERERRENDALAAYAAAAARRKTIDEEVTAKVAGLEREIAAARASGQARQAEVDAEQAKAVAELSQLGRSADQLGQLFGVPAKRIRRMIQEASAGTKSPTAAAKSSGPARPERVADPAVGKPDQATTPEASTPEPTDTRAAEETAVQVEGAS